MSIGHALWNIMDGEKEISKADKRSTRKNKALDCIITNIRNKSLWYKENILNISMKRIRPSLRRARALPLMLFLYMFAKHTLQFSVCTHERQIRMVVNVLLYSHRLMTETATK